MFNLLTYTFYEIVNLAPYTNVQHKDPRVNSLWELLLVTITRKELVNNVSNTEI